MRGRGSWERWSGTASSRGHWITARCSDYLESVFEGLRCEQPALADIDVPVPKLYNAERRRWRRADHHHHRSLVHSGSESATGHSYTRRQRREGGGESLVAADLVDSDFCLVESYHADRDCARLSLNTGHSASCCASVRQRVRAHPCATRTSPCAGGSDWAHVGYRNPCTITRSYRTLQGVQNTQRGFQWSPAKLSSTRR